MKIIKIIYSILLIVLIIFCTNAFAELTLVYAKKVEGLRADGMIVNQKGDAYWMLTSDFADQTLPKIQVYPFKAIGIDHNRVVLPASPYVLVLAKSSISVAKKQVLLVEVSFVDGSVYASLLNDQLTKLNKSVKIESPSFFPIEVMSTNTGYVIGGKSGKDLPALVMLSDTLTKQRLIEFSNQKEGAVLSLFTAKERLYAVANSGSTAYLYEMSLSGDLLASVLLPGRGVIALPLKNNKEIVVAYSNEEGQNFIEKLDEKLKSVWITKLHKDIDVTTEIQNLLEFKTGIAWVGGNNNKLIVHRIDEKNGNLKKTSIDNESTFSIPTHRNGYSVIADGSNIHIRGLAYKKNENIQSMFHFVDTP